MIIDFYIDLLIIIVIIIFFVWIFIIVVLVVYNGCHFIGLIDTDKEAKMEPDNNIISSLIFACRFLVYPIFLFLCWVAVIMSYIFWTWLLIIYFVPHLIFVGIIPIPFKIPILEYVPPFKQLTNRGVLPLIRRINTRLFEFLLSRDFNIHKENIKDIQNFVFEEIKKIFTDFFKILKINYETFSHIIPNVEPVKPVIEETLEDDDKDTSLKLIAKFDEDDEKIKLKNLINEEIAICISNKSKLMSSDLSSSELLIQTQTNRANYSECYAKTINLYLNNQL